MQMLRCRECGTEFIIDGVVDAEEVECPVSRCRSDDLAEFEELDEDDEDEEGEDEPKRSSGQARRGR
ncbi:MAG: hypothetical protein IIC94_08090 [Chloroflexi bacterium]|nr:hypothetical protein [Chloroflexota bacterium]